MVGKYSRLSLLAAFSIVFILAIAGFASARNANSDAGASTTINLTFENTTAAGIIPNGTTRNFWITVRSRSNSQSAMAFTINTTGITGATNLSVTSSLQFYPAFAFTGYVR